MISVSVALATYNGARFLSEQLESLAAQTHQPAELVIQDDRSTDDTPNILQAFASRAPFPVHVEVNDERLGSTANFERAIARCTGTHIALCDQDDVWHPEKLERIAGRFAAAPGLGLVFTNAERVDAHLRPLAMNLWQSLPHARGLPRLVASDEYSTALLRRSFVTGATMVFDARYQGLVAPFPTGFPEWIHDRWIAALIGLVAPADCIDEPLVLYRQHEGQQLGAPVGTPSPNFASSRREMEESLAVLNALRRRLDERQANAIAEGLHQLDEMSAHLEARLALPASRLERIGPVLRELSSGRYGRYSSGAASALKDVILR